MNTKLTVPVSRKLCSIHKAANAALSAKIESREAASASQHDMINITVECEESDIITDSGDGNQYFALFYAMLSKPTPREVSVSGPRRDEKHAAVKDSEVLDRAFQLEGETGVKRVAQRLERKQWSARDGVESCIESLLVDPSAKSGQKQEKLIPPGEGWVRFSDELLRDPRSGVYFSQLGSRMGQYLMEDPVSEGSFREVDTPHTSSDFPVVARAAGASAVRRGAKMERTVLLNELPKIARLALKFPLSFVDTPASAFALFQGLRSPEAADWCAKNFHTKLIPALAAKIHTWQTRELQDALKKVLRELDAELLKSPHAFSACNAVVALLLGERLVVCGIGQVKAVLLFEDGSTKPLLVGTCDLGAGAERERVEAAHGIVHEGLLHWSGAEGLDEAQRILHARHEFDVLEIEAGGPSDEKDLKKAYRKLALRVHPDKISDEGRREAFNQAFARLEAAREALERMLDADGEACRELHRVLRFQVHTREAAAELLGVDKVVSWDTERLVEDAEKASRKLIKGLEKMEGVAGGTHKLAVAMCREAVETIRRPNSVEALPRQEALLRVGLSTSRAMGARDLRFPSPAVLMEPESTSWTLPSDKGCRLALLSGATAAMETQRLVANAARLRRRPKAAALQWCLASEASAASVGAVCIVFDSKAKRGRDEGPAAKRPKTAAGSRDGAVFLRHILFRHQQLRAADPGARREGSCRGPFEAEEKALATLEKLIAAPTTFEKVCRELSDCQTADQPGKLVGHIGWVGRGEMEAGLEEAAFACEPNEFSDVVVSVRGVHILQRLG